MIDITYTYISLSSDNIAQKANIDELEKQLSDFTESQVNVNLEDFLTRFLEKKPLLDRMQINKIAIFHTLLYDNQCNTEFSPTVVDLIQKIGATFCISADCIRRTKRIYNVASSGDGTIEATISTIQQ